MDFEFSEKQKEFQWKVQDFAKREIAPIADQLDERGEFPLYIFRKMGEMGFLGIRYPERYGGMGADLVTLCIFREELTCSAKGVTGCVGVHVAIGTYPIYKFGTEEQKYRYLVPAIRGEKVSAFGLTEPNAGSDVAAMETKARKVDSCYVINGSKIFITNSPIADFITVAARTSEGKGFEGISLFIVERETAGFSVGDKLDKLGIHSSQTAELFFDDCKIPAKNLLGELGKGFMNLKDILDEGRILVGATCVGQSRSTFEETINYVKERKWLRKQQINHFILAEMYTEIEAAKLIVYKTAWLSDKGFNVTKEASMAKLYASTIGRKIAEMSMRIFGADGYTKRYPIQRFLRDSLIWEIGEGTSEIQHLIIAKSIGL